VRYKLIVILIIVTVTSFGFIGIRSISAQIPEESRLHNLYKNSSIEVYNHYSFDITVTFTFYTTSGVGGWAGYLTDTIQSNSKKTYNIADAIHNLPEYWTGIANVETTQRVLILTKGGLSSLNYWIIEAYNLNRNTVYTATNPSTGTASTIHTFMSHLSGPTNNHTQDFQFSVDIPPGESRSYDLIDLPVSNATDYIYISANTSIDLNVRSYTLPTPIPSATPTQTPTSVPTAKPRESVTPTPSLNHSTFIPLVER
jgi:hypothetical protein